MLTNVARTLQELLAPNVVEFFDRDWSHIGDKIVLADAIARKTGVSAEVLKGERDMYEASVAQRMSWAAERRATREEDIAYSLLGIFRLHMPMQYGEGKEAFIRLQKEILKNNNDQPLFAWSPASTFIEDLLEGLPKIIDDRELHGSEYGMFASHPRFFKNCRNTRFLHKFAPNCQITEVNGSLHMQMPLVSLILEPTRRWAHHGAVNDNEFCVGLLPCATMNDLDGIMGVLLQPWSKDGGAYRLERIHLRTRYSTFRVRCPSAWSAESEKIWVDTTDRTRTAQPSDFQLRKLRRSVIVKGDTHSESLQLMRHPEAATWHATHSR